MRWLQLLIYSFIPCLSFAQTDTDLIGQWKDSLKTDRLISITKDQKGLFYGKDQKGQVVLKILTKAQHNTYTGEITPPGTKFTASVRLEFINPDKLKLTMNKLFISKILILNRVQPIKR